MTDLQSAPQRPLTTRCRQITGGMVPPVEPFTGSERLRPDGRPKPELRSELRQIASLRNAVSIIGAFQPW
ncbi:MAG: hypothetical protein R2710_16420 [Acidimicrobiales bacterium]